MIPSTLFMSRLGRVLIAINLAPSGDGSRTVCFWTWDGAPEPTQHQPFIVPSLADAQAYVPAGALRALDAPAGFADEVWMYTADDAVPTPAPAFETEPTMVDAALDLRVRA